MIDKQFVRYLSMVKDEYKSAEYVIKVIDDLVGSVHLLQDDLLDKVKDHLEMDNVSLSIKRLETIQAMGQYTGVSLNEQIENQNGEYSAEFFLDEELSPHLIKLSFIEDLSNFSSLLEDDFNIKLLEVYDALESLYEEMADDLCTVIRGMDVHENTRSIAYVTYLSTRLKKFSQHLHKIVESSDKEYKADPIDREAISRMHELLHYNVIKSNESLFIYIGDLTNEDVLKDNLVRSKAHFVGSILDTGYVTMKNRHDKVPINQSVAVTLKARNIERTQLFDQSELYYDVNGLLRIGIDGIIKRLATNRNGKLVLISTL